MIDLRLRGSYVPHQLRRRIAGLTFATITAGITLTTLTSQTYAQELCEFKAPQVSMHLFPVFAVDHEENEPAPFLVDFLVDSDGKMMMHSILGKPTLEELKAIEATIQLTEFEPALACAEPVTGLCRYSLHGYFVLQGTDGTDFDSMPVPLFGFSDELYTELSNGTNLVGEKRLSFTVDVSETGAIEKIRGNTSWSDHIAKKALNSVVVGERFTPAQINGIPVAVTLRLEIPFERRLASRLVDTVLASASEQRVMPIRPATTQYTEAETFRVNLVLTSQGCVQRIYLYDPLPPEEAVEILKALRSWKLAPPDVSEIPGSAVVGLEFAFPSNAEHALLVREWRSRLVPGKTRRQGPPKYPKDMLKAKKSGSVLVEAIIDETGRISDARAAMSTHPSFSESALKAVRKWRFDPWLKDGEPVKIKIRIPIPFKL